MSGFILYHTSGCHLCEKALSIWQASTSLALAQLDIAMSDQLIESYGVRIPVIKAPDGTSELGWPFDSTALKQFIEANRVN